MPFASLLAVLVLLHIPLNAGGGLVSRATLDRYHRAFAKLGPVSESIGPGSWIDGGRLVFETDVHVSIHTSEQRARAFVPAFLRMTHVELHQHETLAEIVGGTYPGGSIAKRVVVTLPFRTASAGAILRLHQIFDRYAGGASEYDDAGGVRIAASTPPAAVPALETALRANGYAFTATDDTILISSELRRR